MYLRRRGLHVAPPASTTHYCHPVQLSYKSSAHDDAKPKPKLTANTATQGYLPHYNSSFHLRTSQLAMAKCLAVALLLLVVLAHCDGRELNAKDQTLAATRGAGAGAGVGEAKVLGLPDLPLVGTATGTSTITGPLVVLPGIPAIGP
jgi:hypothetical protein